MTDATTRAREVISKFLFLGFECYYDGAPGPQNGDNEAALLLLNLQRAGLAIIDTRTHAAIPREPSEEVVERVARSLYADEWKRAMYPPKFESEGQDVREYWWEQARAAIAALVAAQTQGGEDEDV